jgi:hypothetical protein
MQRRECRVGDPATTSMGAEDVKRRSASKAVRDGGHAGGRLCEQHDIIQLRVMGIHEGTLALARHRRVQSTYLVKW